MVEFLLLSGPALKGLRRQFEIYPRYRRLMTLTLCYQTGSDPGWYVGN
jgi:hypothetical protein